MAALTRQWYWPCARSHLLMS